MKDYGPGAALTASLIVAFLYLLGGIPKVFAGVILLAVLITPSSSTGHSMLYGLLHYTSSHLTGEAMTQGEMK